MTLNETKEILKHELEAANFDTGCPYETALKLAIKGLERIKKSRKNTPPEFIWLLPGESLETLAEKRKYRKA